MARRKKWVSQLHLMSGAWAYALTDEGSAVLAALLGRR